MNSRTNGSVIASSGGLGSSVRWGLIELEVRVTGIISSFLILYYSHSRL